MESPPFPTGKYSVIYADPPWSYNDKMAGHSFSLDHEYPTQSLDWIKSLPVKDIADKNCALFLWAVSPMMPEALEVIKSWGFTFKTVAFVWFKTNEGGNTVWNLGRWTMGNVEVCLLATRGKPKRVCKDVKQVVVSARREHSRKPDEVRKRIRELMGCVPSVELFARQGHEGWEVFGNEADKFDSNEQLKLDI